jgi:hypothetical protein
VSGLIVPGDVSILSADFDYVGTSLEADDLLVFIRDAGGFFDVFFMDFAFLNVRVGCLSQTSIERDNPA